MTKNITYFGKAENATADIFLDTATYRFAASYRNRVIFDETWSKKGDLISWIEDCESRVMEILEYAVNSPKVSDLYGELVKLGYK